MKNCILFVDGEPQVLQGLRRMLHSQVREWELHFAASGAEALEQMEATPMDGDHVEIRISDTGRGIPRDVQSRIFDPFFPTRPVGQGTGQGLTIAYTAIVGKHRGTPTFETEEGRGTTFIIRLPLDG
ncbi:MAG TPA: hypothetical protein ENN39_05210 [Desulfonatronum sp.]|nr:hypothetical protein [Desulfonatronum sp.]